MTELLDQLNERQRDVVLTARDVAQSQGIAAYLVGGPVRDLLLGHIPLDIDITLERDAEIFGRALAERLNAKFSVFPQFLTGKIEIDGMRPVDVATTRKETYRHSGALPEVSPAGLEEDLFRRDFTVNAMALNLVSSELVDHFHGQDDLRRGQIRVLHEASFEDDPTRMYRAIRLAVRLGFTIEGHTRELLKTALERNATASISRERLWRELLLAFDEENASRVVAEFVRAGLVTPIIGRTDVPPDVSDRLDAASARLPDFDADRAVVFLAILHGTTVPDHHKYAGSGLRHRDVENIRAAVSELPDLLNDLRDGFERERLRAAVSTSDELLLLAAASDPGLDDTVARGRAFRKFETGISGTDLDVPPGPHIGRALAATREALFLGEISRDEARGFARRLAQEYLQQT